MMSYGTVIQVQILIHHSMIGYQAPTHQLMCIDIQRTNIMFAE